MLYLGSVRGGECDYSECCAHTTFPVGFNRPLRRPRPCSMKRKCNWIWERRARRALEAPQSCQKERGLNNVVASYAHFRFPPPPLFFRQSGRRASLLFPHIYPRYFPPPTSSPDPLEKGGIYTYAAFPPSLALGSCKGNPTTIRERERGGNLILGSGEGKESLYLLSSTSRGEFHGKESISEIYLSFVAI